MRLKDLSSVSPAETEKAKTKEATEALKKELDVLQNLLYAENKHAVLIILQGLDASGKDGAIKKVFGGLNPQGLQVQSFKVPTEKELSHDFLWRIHQHAPQRGYIQLFNRSHYEDVLVTRVHGWCDDELAKKRFKAINDFERLLVEQNNTIIFKFYLHVSAEEQQKRFAERVEDPAKFWKYNKRDQEEAKLRDQYLEMYEDVFAHCSEVPWVIVPADHNWYKEHIIAKTVVEGLRKVDMKYPKLPEDR
jgi:PPK2 family polyphosphate:nucleotide phosphotransferase